jgi:site-specific recombinase XerD
VEDEKGSDEQRGTQDHRSAEFDRKNDLVFYNAETGKSFADLKAGFGLACEKAGITGVTWHTLRHTFASRWLECGVDIITVQQLQRANGLSTFFDKDTATFKCFAPL